MQVSSRRAPLVIIRSSEMSRGSLQEWCRATAPGPPAYPQETAQNTGSTPGSVDAAAFGAKDDGTADDTASIQRTLDSAAAEGGIVAPTPGKYPRSSTAIMASRQVRDPTAAIASGA